MAFEFNEEAALAAGDSTNSGSKVLDTGVYDVVINTVSKEVASTGTVGMTWNFSVEGSKYPNVVYGFWVQKANGDKIFNMDTLQGLMGIIGAKGLTEYNKTIEVKDGQKTVVAYKELDGVKCKIAIQKEFGYYNGEVTEKNAIKAFFNEDGKTYAEAVRGSEAKQVIYYGEKLKDKEDKDYKAYIADGGADEEPEAEASTGSLL